MNKKLKMLFGFLSVFLLTAEILIGIHDTEATFFRELFQGCLSEHRRIEFRAINNRTDAVEQKFLRSLDEDFLSANNEQRSGWDHYFGIHPRDRNGGSAEAVSFVTCIWADVDWKNFPGGRDEAIQQIRNFVVPPSVVTDSGHGYHVYWFLKEPEPLEDPQCFGRSSGGSSRPSVLIPLMTCQGSSEFQVP